MTSRLWSILGYFIIFFDKFIDGAGHVGCIHAGVEFAHGSYFTPQYPELLSSEQPGQCMQCNCNNAVVYCELMTCALLNCEDDFHRLQPCCKQCPSYQSLRRSVTESVGEPEKSSELFFPGPKPSKARKKSECTSDGKQYKDGSSWQPTIGPLGAMSCVQCACVNGEVSCKRYPCRDLPCSHPRKQFGHCCPVCPVLETLSESSVRCLPRSSEVFVFKRPKMGKTAQVVEYGFIQSSARNRLDLHVWDTSLLGDYKFNTTFMPKTAISDRNLTIAGSTSFKHWTRFVKREKILKSRCNSKCAERVVRLEDTLKLYPVASRPRCRSDEIDTAGL